MGGSEEMGGELVLETPLEVLPPDTPETEESKLIYEFKDNEGGNPLAVPKSKLYLENPENLKTNVKYDPKSGNYNVEQKIGDKNYRPATYLTPKEFQSYMFKR